MTKMGLSFFFSLVAVNLLDFNGLTYQGIAGYAALILQEGITGAIIGLASGFCLYILSFSGNMFDMEIGFSMAMEFDPATNVQSTITSNLFSQLFLALFVVSDMHYFVIDAIYDSYKLIPIGGANLKGDFLSVMTTYITDYFVIGFRIILPIFFLHSDRERGAWNTGKGSSTDEYVCDRYTVKGFLRTVSVIPFDGISAEYR